MFFFLPQIVTALIIWIKLDYLALKLTLSLCFDVIMYLCLIMFDVCLVVQTNQSSLINEGETDGFSLNRI